MISTNVVGKYLKVQNGEENHLRAVGLTPDRLRKH